MHTKGIIAGVKIYPKRYCLFKGPVGDERVEGPAHRHLHERLGQAGIQVNEFFLKPRVETGIYPDPTTL